MDKRWKLITGEGWRFRSFPTGWHALPSQQLWGLALESVTDRAQEASLKQGSGQGSGQGSLLKHLFNRLTQMDLDEAQTRLRFSLLPPSESEPGSGSKLTTPLSSSSSSLVAELRSNVSLWITGGGAGSALTWSWPVPQLPSTSGMFERGRDLPGLWSGEPPPSACWRQTMSRESGEELPNSSV